MAFLVSKSVSKWNIEVTQEECPSENEVETATAIESTTTMIPMVEETHAEGKIACSIKTL